MVSKESHSLLYQQVFIIFPDKAAKIAVKSVNEFIENNPDYFELVEWVLFDSHTASVYEAEVKKTK